MNSVFSTALGPILVLWIGALILDVVDQFLEPQDRGLAELLVLVLSILFLFRARTQLDVPLEFGVVSALASWPGLSPFVILSSSTWRLALLVLGIALLASLASIAKPTSGRAGRLATWGSALLFLSAGDWSTLMMAWLLVDVTLAVTVHGEENRRTLGRTLTLSVSGALALLVASWMWGQGSRGAWPIEAEFSLPIQGLLILAAVLRWMPLPLPSWQSAVAQTSKETPLASRITIYVVPALLGVHLWLRLVAQGQGLPPEGWPARLLALWASLILLWSAFKAWAVRDPDALVRCVYPYGGGLILIGAALGIPATWMLLIGVMAVVTMSALYVAWIYCQHLDLFDVDSWWRAAPTTVVLLCLVGLPLTIGFPARVALYHAILDTQRWLVLPIAIAAEALFVSAMLRLLLDLESVPDPGLAPAIKGTAKEKGRPWRSILAWVRRVDWPRELRYGAGAALALGTLILGVAPGLLSAPGLGTWFALPTLPMWAALLLPVVGAIVLYRAQDSVLDVIGAWWPVAESVLSAEPLYRAVEGTFAYIGAAIWGSSQVVEGAGYMAWVALACLVIYLFIISR